MSPNLYLLDSVMNLYENFSFLLLMRGFLEIFSALWDFTKKDHYRKFRKQSIKKKAHYT